ncbi:MAG: histidinol-phosphate transaminase [Elusimicrobiota bacterium]
MKDLSSLIRPCIRAVAPYFPGKPIAEVRRELGLKRIVKLASNENPLGASPKALRALKDSLGEVHLYPEGGSPLLRKAFARAHGLDCAQVIAGSGSDDILHILCEALLGPEDEVVLSQYSFLRYKHHAAVMGAKIIEVPMEDWTHDLKTMARAVSARTKLVFVTNPNNPTGTYNTLEEVRGLLKALPPSAILVLDEAYYDYAVEKGDYPRSLPDLVRRHQNLFVLRTFSKSYGLAGLRVGVGVGDPSLVAWLDRVRLPFNLTIPSQRAAEAALADSAFLRRSVRSCLSGRESLAKALRSMDFQVVDSAANFLFAQSPLPGRELFKALLRQGVIIRPLDEYGLASHVRVSVGTPEENRFFLAALKKVLSPVSAAAGARRGAPRKAGRKLVIALDGPAGVGKSSAGRRVAQALGCRYLSTGEMYRALAWRALEQDVDLEDERAIARLARRIRWDFRPSSDGVTLSVFVDGKDVSVHLHEERVSRSSSKVSAVPAVRRHLCAIQRRLGRAGGVVMEGRDIGTNVLPRADVKFFLDASVEERARRRTLQLKEQGQPADLGAIREAIAARDLRDRGRKVNPLRKAHDAVLIDSTSLSLDEVVERMLAVVRGGGDA